MSKMKVYQEKVEAQQTSLDSAALSTEPHEDEQAKQTAQEAQAGSIGWAEGLAGEAPEDSKGWVEGMAEAAPAEASIGWAQGLADEALEDSKGWAEGYETAERISEAEAKKHLQSGENLLGKSVFSLKDGRMMGTVKEFYLDRNLEFITGIQLSGEGLFDFNLKSLFKPTFRLVRSDQIVLFGIDVILIINSDAVVDSDQVPELDQWLKLSDLKGRKVETPGGTHIGTVGDIIFKPGQGGHILGFTLLGVFVDGPLSQTRAIARDVVIEPGSEDHFMTIDLARAEQQELNEAMIG